MKDMDGQMKTNQCYKTIGVLLLIVFGGILTGCFSGDGEDKTAIALGTWIETTKISEADGEAHPVKYKIDEVVRNQTDVEEAIAEYNASGTGNSIQPLENDDLEFCIAEYLVSFPEDFPQKEFGITDVVIPFEIVSLQGGEIEIDQVIYKNIRTTWEIGPFPQGYDFHAGDIYYGKIVFAMVKGYDQYLFHEIKDSTEEDQQTYIKGQ